MLVIIRAESAQPLRSDEIRVPVSPILKEFAYPRDWRPSTSIQVAVPGLEVHLRVQVDPGNIVKDPHIARLASANRSTSNCPRIPPGTLPKHLNGPDPQEDPGRLPNGYAEESRYPRRDSNPSARFRNAVRRIHRLDCLSPGPQSSVFSGVMLSYGPFRPGILSRGTPPVSKMFANRRLCRLGLSPSREHIRVDLERDGRTRRRCHDRHRHASRQSIVISLSTNG